MQNKTEEEDRYGEDYDERAIAIDLLKKIISFWN